MLTSIRPSSGSNGGVKSLHENPSESKTPEVELNHVKEVQSQTQLSTNYQESDSKQEEEWAALPIESSLSTRASQMKSAINSQETVKAVVLSPDGSASEISYSTNSKQASKVLSGRPTIIGQLEDIGVVVARSLNQSGQPNKNVLPAPLSNASFNGNYLLFAVDSEGFSKDFSLGEYEKYSQSKKSETEQAQKEFDGKQISIKSALNSSFSYDLTKVYIQSEIDKKCKSDKISEAESIKSLVSDFLNADSSPMNDPEYSPEDETEFDESETADYEDGRDWREQLEDALVSVRERGHADGEYLAERISATFYELNGVEPSLSELRGVFDSIEQDLANEAEEDLESEKNYDAQRLAEQLASNLTDNPDPTELVDYSMQIVGMDLVSRAKAAYSSINGGQPPSKKALKRSVEKLALKLAADAISGFSAEQPKKSGLAMYDPSNFDDQILAQYDQIEDEQFNSDHFNLKMLTTASTSKKGKYEAYDVYFSNFDKATEEANLKKAIDSFKMRNRRSPSGEEVDDIRSFLATNKEVNMVKFKLSVISDSDEAEEKGAEKKNEKLLVTPVKKKKDAARFNVYFDDSAINQNTETALKWFERFNNRAPTKLEMSGIESFIQTDKSELIECSFDVSSFDISKAADSFDDDSKEDGDRLVQMKTSKSIKKKTSTKYELDFADKSRANGDAKQAMKWFERFNGRSANKEEQARISSFVKADQEQTIDID